VPDPDWGQDKAVGIRYGNRWIISGSISAGVERIGAGGAHLHGGLHLRTIGTRGPELVEGPRDDCAPARIAIFRGCRFAHPRLPAGTPAGVLGKGGFRRITPCSSACTAGRIWPRARFGRPAGAEVRDGWGRPRASPTQLPVCAMPRAVGAAVDCPGWNEAESWAPRGSSPSSAHDAHYPTYGVPWLAKA